MDALSLIGVAFSLRLHLDDNVFSDFDDQMEMEVVVVAPVKVKIDILVEKGVGDVEVEVAVDVEAHSECRLAVGFEDYGVLRHPHLLHHKSPKKSDLLLILEPVMRKMDVNRRKVHQFEIPLSLEYPKLLIVVLYREIERYDICPLLYPMFPDYLIIAFEVQRPVERGEVVLQKRGVVDFAVLLERDVAHFYPRLD